jgi:hypothetical protein
MKAEHLCAIALQTGRSKDFTRLLTFLESGTLEAEAFDAVLVRHGLVDAWARFEERFLA